MGSLSGVLLPWDTAGCSRYRATILNLTTNRPSWDLTFVEVITGLGSTKLIHLQTVPAKKSLQHEVLRETINKHLHLPARLLPRLQWQCTGAGDKRKQKVSCSTDDVSSTQDLSLG